MIRGLLRLLSCCAVIWPAFVSAMDISDARGFLEDQNQPAFLLQGVIQSGDAERLADVLRGGKNIETIVIISSDGGNVDAAFDLAAVIEEHGDIRLIVADRCVSACATILFPAARTSELLPSARLGFHSCYEGSTRQSLPECNERIAERAVENGFPYGAVMMLTQNVPANEIVWIHYPMARCYGYYRRDGDPIPIEQKQPCVRGIMLSISLPLGPHYYEASLVADCRNLAGNTEFMLCRERELRGMLALTQQLYEIALSYTPEDEQSVLEQQQSNWATDMMASCPAEGVLEEILSDRKRAREPVRCLADRLYERIDILDGLVETLT